MLAGVNLDRAERAARAEERKNEEEKHAWHREQIAECEKKVGFQFANLLPSNTGLNSSQTKLREIGSVYSIVSLEL